MRRKDKKMKMTKILVSLMLTVVLAFGAVAAFAGTFLPEDDGYEHLAGRTLQATIGEYNDNDGTFTVKLYDYDHYEPEDIMRLSVGDTLLAGGRLYRIDEINTEDGITVYHSDNGTEICFVNAPDDDDDLIAQSTDDDRRFMHVTAELHLPAAEGIILEDRSDPDAAAPVIIEGLEEILKIKAEKEETSNGLDFYATDITLNGNLEIVRIHQVFDVAQ